MTEQRLPQPFDQQFRARIVQALRGAYREADEVYAPDRGRGDHLHSLAVYHVATFNLRRDLDGVPGVSLDDRGRGPELRVGPYALRWNKVGRGEDADGIGGAFPRGSAAASVMAEKNQLRLFTDADLELAGFVPNWIIAHVGNAIDGLLAVYLASPISTVSGRVTGWRDAVAIWSAAEPEAAFPSAPLPGLPDAVDIGWLPVELLDDEAIQSS